jgi:hypothetical protein
MPTLSPRLRAAAIHAAIGTALALVAALLVRFGWYPDALFNALGAERPLALLAAGLVLAGPAATFAVFVPGKRGLKFDLLAIGVLSATFAGFVLWTLFEARPVYVVFVKDRFELVRAGDFPESEIARAGSSPYLELPLFGPRYVTARMPVERIERDRIMFLAPTGMDLHHMPQHYAPYEQSRAEVSRRSEPLGKLRTLNPSKADVVDSIPRAAGRPEDAVGFLPMRAGDSDLTVVVDRGNGDPLRLLALRPWEF